MTNMRWTQWTMGGITFFMIAILAFLVGIREGKKQAAEEQKFSELFIEGIEADTGIYELEHCEVGFAVRGRTIATFNTCAMEELFPKAEPVEDDISTIFQPEILRLGTEVVWTLGECAGWYNEIDGVWKKWRDGAWEDVPSGCESPLRPEQNYASQD